MSPSSSGVARNGPRGAKAVGAFAFVPLAAAFFLPGALAVVVHQSVAGDVSKGVFFIHVAGLFTDDECEFDFPVGVLAVTRDDERIVGAAKGGGGFEKGDRLRWASQRQSRRRDR